MITSVLGLLGVVLSFIFWLVKRHVAKKDDPKTQHKNRVNFVDEAIVKEQRGVDDINVLLSDFDNKLR